MSAPTERDLRGSEISDGSNNHIVSTELNSLANNALVLSSVINTDGHFSNNAGDSAGNGAPLLILHLHLAALGGSATAGSVIDGWFLKSDGTNYESGSASVTPARAPDFSFPLIAQSQAQDVEIVVPAPIGTLIKTLTRNNGSGQTLAASGSYIEAYPLTVTVPTV